MFYGRVGPRHVVADQVPNMVFVLVTIYRDRTALSVAAALLICKARVGPRHVVAV